MCGEKDDRSVLLVLVLGSPPHVRGKDNRRKLLCQILGITPACAGKSRYPRTPDQSLQDHPRMCGEKQIIFSIGASVRGSPPHVREKADIMPVT